MSQPINMYDPTRDYRAHQEEYLAAVAGVMEHGLFINGPELKELEQKLADYVGVKHCLGVASGTDALLVALMGLGVGQEPDDEVITVAHSWISTAEVIALLGANPVFVDIEPDTFNIDPELIAAAITPRTKAIMPVSLYGQMPDYQKIKAIAKRPDGTHIPIIEDGAQSFGAAQQGSGKSCGVTDIGCTSFFPSKPMGGYGDNGAVFTDDDELAQKIRAIRNHGALKRFNHQWIGLNARMDTVQAAILLVKLKYLDGVLQRRREVADYYSQTIRESSVADASTCIKLPPTKEGNTHVWAQYSLLLANKEERDRTFDHLKSNGVNPAIFYPAALHLQPCFQYLGYKQGDLPVTEDVCDRVLNLPCYGEITSEEQDRVVQSLIGYFTGDEK